MERTVLIAGGTTALTLGGLKAASSGLASKGAMAAVALAIVGTTAAVTVAVVPSGFLKSPRREPSVQINRAAPPAPLPAPSPEAVLTPTPTPEDPLPAPVETPVPVTTAPPRREREQLVRPSVPPAAPLPENAAAPSPLAAELAILRAAKNELDASRWTGALEALARHDLEFPEGALRVEAEVIRVLAWCGQGRTGEAMQRAFELRTKTPNSPAIARLDGSCVDL
jgi:hypothetical protein